MQTLNAGSVCRHMQTLNAEFVCRHMQTLNADFVCRHMQTLNVEFVCRHMQTYWKRKMLLRWHQSRIAVVYKPCQRVTLRHAPFQIHCARQLLCLMCRGTLLRVCKKPKLLKLCPTSVRFSRPGCCAVLQGCMRCVLKKFKS